MQAGVVAPERMHVGGAVPGAADDDSHGVRSGLAGAEEVDRLLLARREVEQSVHLGVEEAADGDGGEAEGVGHEIKVLSHVPRLQPDVAVAARAILPLRAREDRRDADHEVGVAQHLLAQGHAGELSVELAGPAQLQLVGPGVVVIEAVGEPRHLLRRNVKLQRIEAAARRHRPLGHDLPLDLPAALNAVAGVEQAAEGFERQRRERNRAATAAVPRLRRESGEAGRNRAPAAACAPHRDRSAASRASGSGSTSRSGSFTRTFEEFRW